MDDDAVDAARELRGRGEARRRRTSPSRRARVWSGSSRSAPRPSSAAGTASCAAPRGAELVGRPYHGPFASLPAQAEVAAARDRVGRRRRRRGHGHRPHRARLRRGGLRAGQARGPARARAGRRGRRLPRAVRLAARPPHGRRHDGDRRGPRPARPPAARGRADAPLPRLLALRHRADLPRRGRVVHLRRRRPRADARGQPDRGVGAGALRQAHGRLAAQHGRLVHLPQALLGPAAAVLPRRRRAS